MVKGRFFYGGGVTIAIMGLWDWSQGGYRPWHSKNISGQENFKFQDIFQDIKPRQHAEKVPLKSSKNTILA